MSLNIVIDADVSTATQNISKFVYTVKQNFQELEKVTRKAAGTTKSSTDQMTESVKSFGKASQNSLTALSLTLQDLPFGFIGIQNNLPGIIQGLGQMSAEAKTGASVMSQLKGALIGPAGIFLAFSAVTAIVTSLTMKYGSLGAAIDALFTKQTKFNEVIVRAGESLKEYNKSLITNNELIGQAGASQAGQALSARALLSSVLDLTKTETERKKALDGLKALDEERFKNFDIEKGKINGLKQAVAAYTRALVAQSVASKFVDQVSTTSVELEKQRNALGELFKQLDDLQKKYPNLSAEAKKYSDELIASQGRLGAGLVQPGKGVLDYIATFKKIGEQEGVIQGLVKQLEDLNKATISAVQSASKLASPYKQAKGKVEDLGKVIYGEGGVGTLTETSEAFKRKLLMANMRLWWGDDGMLSRELDKALRARQELLKKKNEKALTEFIPKRLDKNAGPLNKNPLIEYQFGQITAIIDALKEEAKFIDDAFREPLENLFIDFLQKGKLSFEDFTKSVVKNIGQIVAKLAASKIFEALANLIPQIAGTLVPGGTQLLQVANFLGTGRSILRGANLSGVDGGGMNLNGQVVFVQRGTDLVGVMNRTNSQISRIG
jgi:hypothetical protein